MVKKQTILHSACRIGMLGSLVLATSCTGGFGQRETPSSGQTQEPSVPRRDRIEIEVKHTGSSEPEKPSVEGRRVEAAALNPEWQRCDPSKKENANEPPQCIPVPMGDNDEDQCLGCFGKGYSVAINIEHLTSFKQGKEHCKNVKKPEGMPTSTHETCQYRSAECGADGVCKLSSKPPKMPPQQGGQGGGMPQQGSGGGQGGMMGSGMMGMPGQGGGMPQMNPQGGGF